MHEIVRAGDCRRPADLGWRDILDMHLLLGAALDLKGDRFDPKLHEVVCFLHPVSQRQLLWDQMFIDCYAANDTMNNGVIGIKFQLGEPGRMASVKYHEIGPTVYVVQMNLVRFTDQQIVDSILIEHAG